MLDNVAVTRPVGFRTGLDLWRGSLIPGHRDVAGVYFTYGNSNVDVSGLVTNPAATAYVLRPATAPGPDQCGVAKEPLFHYETEPLIGDERPRLPQVVAAPAPARRDRHEVSR